MKTGIKVADIMSRNPVVVGPELSLRHCAETMIRNRVGSLVVKKEKKLLGILTGNEFVRAAANNVDLEKTNAIDIMVKNVKTIKPNDDVYDALVKMSKKDLRRLPVVSKKELVGLLTIGDVLKIQPRVLDLLTEKLKVIGFRTKIEKPKYLEGECEVCGNYSKLYDVKGALTCEECRDNMT